MLPDRPSFLLKIKFTINVCRLNFYQIAPPFSRKCIFYQNFDRPWCAMVSIDFVSEIIRLRRITIDSSGSYPTDGKQLILSLGRGF